MRDVLHIIIDTLGVISFVSICVGIMAWSIGWLKISAHKDDE